MHKIVQIKGNIHCKSIFFIYVTVSSPIKELSKKYLAPHQDDLDHRWLVLMFLPLGAAVIGHVVLVWLE
jgi:hypothetical protein